LKSRLRRRKSGKPAATARDESMGRLLKTKQQTQAPPSTPVVPDIPTAPTQVTLPPPQGSSTPVAPSQSTSTPQPRAEPVVPTANSSQEDDEAELDTMERLRRAKRRARGEE
jgi:hypothetical protein